MIEEDDNPEVFLENPDVDETGESGAGTQTVGKTGAGPENGDYKLGDIVSTDVQK